MFLSAVEELQGNDKKQMLPLICMIMLWFEYVCGFQFDYKKLK